MQKVAGGAWGRGAAWGCWRGRRSAERVHSGQRARVGRRRVPQWRHIRGAEAGGGAGVRGGFSWAKGWGEGSRLRRRSAPARQASGGRGYRAAWKAAQAKVGRSGAQEAGRVSGRASQLCVRALGNMAPRTALPDVGAEGVVRPWCLGERRGEERGGDSWRLRLAGRG